jgi:hypothetical protein
MFVNLEFDELDKLEEKLTEVVPQERITAAGLASLKIDTFSKAACGIPFANT